MMPIIVPAQRQEPQYSYFRVDRLNALAVCSQYISRAMEKHAIEKKEYLDKEIKEENEKRSRFPWKLFYKQLSREEGESFAYERASMGTQFFTLGDEPPHLLSAKEVLAKAKNSNEETIVVRADNAYNLGLV